MGPGDAPCSQGRRGGNEGGRTVPAWAASALSWLPDRAAQPDSCVAFKLKMKLTPFLETALPTAISKAGGDLPR